MSFTGWSQLPVVVCGFSLWLKLKAEDETSSFGGG